MFTALPRVLWRGIATEMNIFSRDRGAAEKFLRHFCQNTTMPAKFAFVGAGQMGEAMIEPLTRTSILGHLPFVSFFDVSSKVASRVEKKYPSAKRAKNLADCVQDADVVVLCTKAQNCDTVFAELKPLFRDHDPVLLSILAGVPLDSYVAGTGLEKVIRSMPNTPSMIGHGMTVWTKNRYANFSENELTLCKASLRAMGKEIFVEEENFIDMSTSISGSGPAYVFLLIEAMVDAGVQEGFSREVATELVHQTLLGSTLYAMESKEHPAVLKNSVTSPAGTTASAIYTLERGNFRTVVQDAIWSCYRRSLEMAGKDSHVGPGRSAGPSPSTEFPDVDLR